MNNEIKPVSPREEGADIKYDTQVRVLEAESRRPFRVQLRPQAQVKLDLLAEHYDCPRGTMISLLIGERYDRMVENIGKYGKLRQKIEDEVNKNTAAKGDAENKGE